MLFIPRSLSVSNARILARISRRRDTRIPCYVDIKFPSQCLILCWFVIAHLDSDCTFKTWQGQANFACVMCENSQRNVHTLFLHNARAHMCVFDLSGHICTSEPRRRLIFGCPFLFNITLIDIVLKDNFISVFTLKLRFPKIAKNNLQQLKH